MAALALVCGPAPRMLKRGSASAVWVVPTIPRNPSHLLARHERIGGGERALDGGVIMP